MHQSNIYIRYETQTFKDTNYMHHFALGGSLLLGTYHGRTHWWANYRYVTFSKRIYPFACLSVTKKGINNDKMPTVKEITELLFVSIFSDTYKPPFTLSVFYYYIFYFTLSGNFLGDKPDKFVYFTMNCTPIVGCV